MLFEIALRNYLQLWGDVKEGVEKLFGEDRHFVDEGIRAVFFVEDEDGRWVVVSDAFWLVVVVVDTVEIDPGVPGWLIFCKLFKFTSKFLASVTVVRVMIYHFVDWLLYQWFVLFSSDLLSPSFIRFLWWEVLFCLTTFTIFEPCLQFGTIDALFCWEKELILESTAENVLHLIFAEFSVYFIGFEALGRIVIFLVVYSCLFNVWCVI
jgi:hypothetical protein